MMFYIIMQVLKIDISRLVISYKNYDRTRLRINQIWLFKWKLKICKLTLIIMCRIVCDAKSITRMEVSYMCDALEWTC